MNFMGEMNSSFSQVRLVIGKIISAIPFEKARKPAYQLILDFGQNLGKKQSSAQLTKGYIDPAQLVGNLAVGILNFPRRLVAGFRSEVLVLGFYVDEVSVKLMQPDCREEQLIGQRIGLVDADKFLLSSEEAEISYSIFEALRIRLGVVVEVENENVWISCGDLGHFLCSKNPSITIQKSQKIVILTDENSRGYILMAKHGDSLIPLTTSELVPEGVQLF
jgi:tRNA-binding protein